MRIAPGALALLLALPGGLGGGPGGPWDAVHLHECLALPALVPLAAAGATAQVGQGALTAQLDAAGTVTVLRWPGPGWADQMRLFARDAAQPHAGALPNEGVFAGLSWTGEDGARRFAWLRDTAAFAPSQAYLSDDDAVLRTRFDGGAFAVTLTALVPPGGAEAPLRLRFDVERVPGAAAGNPRVVLFAHLYPQSLQAPNLPLLDWCQEAADGAGWWDPAMQAAVVQGPGAAAAVALEGATAHQLGGDAHALGVPAVPRDAYDDAAATRGELSGSPAAAGLVTLALAAPVALDAGGRGGTTATLAFAGTVPGALAALGEGRAAPWEAQLAATQAWWREALADARLPDFPPGPDAAKLAAVATRSLIVMLQNLEPATATIVASASAEPPYAQDWPRDGAYIDRALERAGRGDLVPDHARFYARVQTGAQGVVPTMPRPPGAWAMNYYPNGAEGGPIPWEIDEVGFGLWALVAPGDRLAPAARAAWLEEVHPAIRRAADLLVAWRDPRPGREGLPLPASEDDHLEWTQTLVGAGPVHLGLREAARAARALGMGEEAARWEARAAELRGAALGAFLDPATGTFDADPRTGAVAVWPGGLLDPRDPRAAAELLRGQRHYARHVAMDPALAGTGGQYEGKLALATAVLLRDPAFAAAPAERAELEARNAALIRWLGTALTTPATHHFGEHYDLVAAPGGGLRAVPSVGLPHTWEHALFLDAALVQHGGVPWTPASQENR